MLDLFTHFGSSGLGALGLNLSSFIIQLITFIIALLILKRFAFKPILKIMKERRDTISKGVELGEQMQKDKAELEQRVAKEIAEARSKADAIIAGANEAARDTVRKAETEAESKAGIIISEAKEQTKQDMQAAKRRLKGEIVNLVSEATEVITKEKIDQKKDAELIERAIAGGTSR